MRIQSDMNDHDIRNFFRNYVNQANPSAVCARLTDSIRNQILTSRSHLMSTSEQKLLKRFLIALELLEKDMKNEENRL